MCYVNLIFSLFICATSYLVRLGHVHRISDSSSVYLPGWLATSSSSCDFQPQKTQATTCQTAPLWLRGSVKGPFLPFRLYDKYHRPSGLWTMKIHFSQLSILKVQDQNDVLVGFWRDTFFQVADFCILTWWKGLENSLEPVFYGTNHTYEGFTVMT